MTQQIAAPRNVVLRTLARKPLAVASMGFLVVLTVLCLSAAIVSPYDPLSQDLANIKSLPSAAHLLGTDSLGRDTLSRLLFGGVPTLLGVAVAVAVASILGISLGIMSGFLGGTFDVVSSAVIDIVIAIPTIVILLSVLAFVGQDMTWAMVALGVLGSVGIARVIRSATISVRQDLYIDAARVNGLRSMRIMLSHVLPRVSAPITVQVSLFAASAVIAQTGISFLGLGIQPPAPSWGGMIAEASGSISDFPWLLVPSGGAVALTILAFGLAGDGIRDSITEAWAGSRAPSARRAKAPSNSTTETEASHDATAVLSLRGLSVATDDGRPILQGVSLDVQPGEVLGLVGESGSGKTTTGLASIGLLPNGLHVTHGALQVEGTAYRLGDRSSMRTLWGHSVGLISQEPMIALDPCYTVGYTLAEAVRLRTRLSKQQVRIRVKELLEQVRISEPDAVALKYPHELSGGMAQRVAIARALATSPKVLIADEPTTALDVTVQAEILALLRTLKDELGMAIILVTHDWGVVADLCDRAMVLYRGEVVEVGDVHAIFHEATHPYTRALLAANPHAAPAGTRLPTVADLMMEEATA